jgi:Na+-transporting NADH:ubiquinone oxidoreductase subunit C
MKDSLSQTIIYAAVLGIACSLFLTGAAVYTKPYIEVNKEAEKIKNILGVLEIPFDEKAPAAELSKIYEQNVKTSQRGELTVYEYSPADGGGEVAAVAMHFDGPGLWGPIRGFLSLGPDMKTIRGVTFYEQEETPGLGGDIVSAEFCSRFGGKSIEDDKGNAGIRFVYKGASATNEVDGISGATITCDKVEDMINAVIEQIIKERDKNG